MIDFSDLQAVVADFAEMAPLTVNRPGPATVVGGRRMSGALVPVADIVGSCWPVSGESITMLEGHGQRVTAGIDIFTPYDALVVCDDRTSQPGDQVTHAGKTYEIIARHEWLRGPLWHYVAQEVRG